MFRYDSVRKLLDIPSYIVTQMICSGTGKSLIILSQNQIGIKIKYEFWGFHSDHVSSRGLLGCDVV